MVYKGVREGVTLVNLFARSSIASDLGVFEERSLRVA